LRRSTAFVIATAGVLACRQIAGIETITYTDGATGDAMNGGDGGCPLGTPLYTTASAYSSVGVQGGNVFVDVPTSGIFACSVTGCVTPQVLVNVAAPSIYESFALGSSSLYYTFLGANQDGGPTGGSVHEVALDGGNDHPIASSLAYPFWVATSGDDVFWIDDSLSDFGTTPATVNCIGCNGVTTSVPWITNLSTTYAIIADANTVWVLADDGSGNGTDVVVACSTTTACHANPKTVVTGIISPLAALTTTTNLGSYFAGDGTYAYVVGNTSIIRTDNVGTNKSVVPGVTSIEAIAIDVPTGNLYYANDSTIYRTKADGTSTSTPVVCNQSGLSALAVDSENVYFLTSDGTITNGAPNFAPK
jgi:hypothetical protein